MKAAYIEPTHHLYIYKICHRAICSLHYTVMRAARISYTMQVQPTQGGRAMEMTSAVETAPSHHRAWYESVGVPGSRSVNEDSVTDSMASSVVEHMSSFFAAAHHNSAAAAALIRPRPEITDRPDRIPEICLYRPDIIISIRLTHLLL
ncbi:hypothetical protein U1Q18_049633 [Sarracenia purpurea var. burkii]